MLGAPATTDQGRARILHGVNQRIEGFRRPQGAAPARGLNSTDHCWSGFAQGVVWAGRYDAPLCSPAAMHYVAKRGWIAARSPPPLLDLAGTLQQLASLDVGLAAAQRWRNRLVAAGAPGAGPGGEKKRGRGMVAPRAPRPMGNGVRAP